LQAQGDIAGSKIRAGGLNAQDGIAAADIKRVDTAGRHAAARGAPGEITAGLDPAKIQVAVGEAGDGPKI